MNKENKFEKDVRDHLQRATDEAGELKEETWSNIQRELFSTPAKQQTFKWGRGLIAGVGGIAAVAILLFGLLSGIFSDQLHVAPNEGANRSDSGTEDTTQVPQESNEEDQTEEKTLLRDQFPEEKQEEIEMEGMKEQIHVRLATNEELRYIIYYDQDRYVFKHGADMDRIEPKNKDELDESNLEVAMDIMYVTNETVDEYMDGIKDMFAAEGFYVIEEKSVTAPIEGMMITAIQDENYGDWDTPVIRYYLMSNPDGSLFVFIQSFFNEAFEGHGVRMDYMLESFEYVTD